MAESAPEEGKNTIEVDAVAAAVAAAAAAARAICAAAGPLSSRDDEHALVSRAVVAEEATGAATHAADTTCAVGYAASVAEMGGTTLVDEGEGGAAPTPAPDPAVVSQASPTGALRPGRAATEVVTKQEQHQPPPPPPSLTPLLPTDVPPPPLPPADAPPAATAAVPMSLPMSAPAPPPSLDASGVPHHHHQHIAAAQSAAQQHIHGIIPTAAAAHAAAAAAYHQLPPHMYDPGVVVHGHPPASPTPLLGGQLLLPPQRKTPRRQCRFPGCTKTIKSQGHCQKHGAKAKRCKVEGCEKQAQGTHDGMCKRHWKEVNQPRQSQPKPADLAPMPTGPSIYDTIVPTSIAWKASKRKGEHEGRDVMPLVAHLRDNSHLEAGWHRNQERLSRGIKPTATPAAQFEPWERQLCMFEIMLMAGTLHHSHKDLAHGWGREKGFHNVLVNQVCERRGELERKKRSDTGRTFTAEQRATFKVKLQRARCEKRARSETHTVPHDEASSDVISMGMDATPVYGTSPQHGGNMQEDSMYHHHHHLPVSLAVQMTHVKEDDQEHHLHPQQAHGSQDESMEDEEREDEGMEDAETAPPPLPPPPPSTASSSC